MQNQKSTDPMTKNASIRLTMNIDGYRNHRNLSECNAGYFEDIFQLFKNIDIMKGYSFF